MQRVLSCNQFGPAGVLKGIEHELGRPEGDVCCSANLHLDGEKWYQERTCVLQHAEVGYVCWC